MVCEIQQSDTHIVYLTSVLGKIIPAPKDIQVRLCDPMDCSSSGSSVHGILQARVLEWVAISFFRASSQPCDRTQVSCLLHWWVDSSALGHLGSPQVTRPDTFAFLIRDVLCVVLLAL